MIITVDMVMGWGPCVAYTRERVTELVGNGLTPLVACDLQIPMEDKLWALLHDEIIPDQTLRLLACRWAEKVLPIYEQLYPCDMRPREAIRAGRWRALGRVDAAASIAAFNAASAAASAAVFNAAGAAVSAAASAAVRNAQFADVRAVLRGELDLVAEAKRAIEEVTT